MLTASLYIGFLLLALGSLGQSVSGLAWLVIAGLAACWGLVVWSCCRIAKKSEPKPEPANKERR